MLRASGHEVRTAIRLNDELAEWAVGIVRFAPYPGPPARDEAKWFRDWLNQDPDRWLIYVVRDFDTVAEYWKTVAEGLAGSNESAREAEAEEKRSDAADWVGKLPSKAKSLADPHEWFANDTAWYPARICAKLSGPWAEGLDATAAGITVHEALKSSGGRVLLEGDGKALVIETAKGGNVQVLAIVNGSFLLNEALAHPARRPLAERVLEWADRVNEPIAFVDGAFVLGGADRMPSLWDLLRRIGPLRWAAAQLGIAALLAALARAPRLGRPRPDPPSGADRPVEHALALGALLARTGAADQAHELLNRFRRWRIPRASDVADASVLPHDSVTSGNLPAPPRLPVIRRSMNG
jgi:plasmid stabilization system protein ParE